MKTFRKIAIPLMCLTLVCGTLTSIASPLWGTEVVTYPAPAEEVQAAPYKVWVNDLPVDIYAARTLDPPFADQQWNYGGPYYFANFDISGPVTVKVQAIRSLRNIVIRPRSYEINPQITSDDTVTFRVERPTKVSVEPDGKNSPLLLFANPLETEKPSVSSPGVIYYGPGVHHVERITLTDNQTLYLAGGAVMQAEVLVQGNHVKICGRGIIDGSAWKWREGPVGNLIAIRDSRDVEISGVTLRGSSHWTIVPSHSQNITIRNVKLCNSRVQNDDGINPCNSQDVLITDCFIRSDDDCIALKGLELREGKNSSVERITIENCIFWCDRARIFLLGHESRAEFMRDVTIRDLDIIHFTMTAFLFEPGEEMRLENIHVEDIRIEGEGQDSLIRLKPVVNQYMHTKVPGHIRNVMFDKVDVTGQPGKYRIEFGGADEEHRLSEVKLRNVRIGSQAVTPSSANLEIGPHVERIEYGP